MYLTPDEVQAIRRGEIRDYIDAVHRAMENNLGYQEVPVGGGSDTAGHEMGEMIIEVLEDRSAEKFVSNEPND